MEPADSVPQPRHTAPPADADADADADVFASELESEPEPVQPIRRAQGKKRSKAPATNEAEGMQRTKRRKTTEAYHEAMELERGPADERATVTKRKKIIREQAKEAEDELARIVP